jgi:hypothetical protein
MVSTKATTNQIFSLDDLVPITVGYLEFVQEHTESRCGKLSILSQSEALVETAKFSLDFLQRLKETEYFPNESAENFNSVPERIVQEIIATMNSPLLYIACNNSDSSNGDRAFINGIFIDIMDGKIKFVDLDFFPPSIAIKQLEHLINGVNTDNPTQNEIEVSINFSTLRNLSGYFIGNLHVHNSSLSDDTIIFSKSPHFSKVMTNIGFSYENHTNIIDYLIRPFYQCNYKGKEGFVVIATPKKSS